MKALPVLLLALLVVGCHFDKLFSGSGGGAASRGGPAPPTATHLIFITQPSNAAAGTKITPPVRVAAVDDQDKIVTGFSGTISIAIGQNGSLLGNARLSGTTNDVPVVNGVATFADLSIDQPGIDYTLVASNARPWSVQSKPFDIGVL
jgi:adhesin/invasin